MDQGEDKIKDTPKKIVILYGSQTGTAEDLAKRIGYMAKYNLSLNVVIQAMDDYPIVKLAMENIVIFVCSTTGFGQEPENMKKFYNFIRRRDLPKACLTNLNFAVYGLGDSSYVKFNFVSKILFKRLIECGAKPLQELITGNEQATFGCDTAIYPKLQELWHKLDSSYEKVNCLDQTLELASLKPKKNSYILKTKSSTQYILSRLRSNFENSQEYSPSSFPSDIVCETISPKSSHKNIAYCILNKRITSEDHFQDTRHLSFEYVHNTKYEPGDVCTIFPQNSDDDVEQFITLLNLDSKELVSLEKIDKNYMVNYFYDSIPNGICLGEMVKRFLDILSVPKRSFFEYLWQFSEDELEKAKLQEFATTCGQEEMSEYCIQPKRSILEVLADFPYTVKNIELEYILDLIPPIKPRSFSIASSNRLHPKEIHLIVGVVKYQTRLRKTRRGLCSTYLSKLESINSFDMYAIKSNIEFTIQNTSFKLPKDSETPIIMIGPGLGIAPFRAFIEQLYVDCSAQRKYNRTIYLYFGCRYQNADFYFKEELEEYSRIGLINLRCAFSREKPKKYVQDLMLEDSKILSDLIINKGAVIYVAGNSKLPESIRDSIKNIIGNSDDSDLSAADYIAKLESQNRLQYDCW